MAGCLDNTMCQNVNTDEINNLQSHYKRNNDVDIRNNTRHIENTDVAGDCGYENTENCGKCTETRNDK